MKNFKDWIDSNFKESIAAMAFTVRVILRRLSEPATLAANLHFEIRDEKAQRKGYISKNHL
ncbi:MAG: hypothetical protein ACAF41_02850 [Leptolyngbya sp. BL-A-14]